MTPEQREELKQAAMKATPGPWEATRQTDEECNFVGYFIEAGKKAISDDGTAPDANDALYIAAANPSAILFLIAQVEALTVPQWISADNEPEVPVGDYREFIVACKRANGKTHVFSAYFLNGKSLLSRWGDDPDEPEDGTPVTGWFFENEVDGDNVFELVCYDGDAITHFMAMPTAPTIPAIPRTKEGA